MEEKRVRLTMLNCHPDITRRAVRSKGKWKDADKSHLKSLKVKDWRDKLKKRASPKMIVGSELVSK